MISHQLITNRFELHDLLGCGGIGDIYRAANMQTGETVAVKVTDMLGEEMLVVRSM